MPPTRTLVASASIAAPQNQAAEKRAFGVFTMRPARKKSSPARMKFVIDVTARMSIVHACADHRMWLGAVPAAGGASFCAEQPCSAFWSPKIVIGETAVPSV
jgi:hypothetical protein